MLEKNIEDIICFAELGGINPSEPGTGLMQRLAQTDTPNQAGLVVYDFEFNRLFFANSHAKALLANDEKRMSQLHEGFLENLLHPASYQLLQFEMRLCNKKHGGCFSNVYCIKTDTKRKYSWVYASARIAGYTAAGVPKLIYVCFIEVEKALHSYVKILNGSLAPIKEDDKPKQAWDSLKPRELEILGFIAAECTSKEIADKLHITQAAVDASRKRLIQKLGVKSVVGLVKVALALGLDGNEVHVAAPKVKQLPRTIRTLNPGFNPDMKKVANI